MDGPNVNLKFLRDFISRRSEELPDAPGILEVGICSLHVVHGAFKTCMKLTSLNGARSFPRGFFPARSFPRRFVPRQFFSHQFLFFELWRKNNEAGNSLNAVEREPVPTRVLSPNVSKANYKPKQRSYRKTKLHFFNFFSGRFWSGGFCRRDFTREPYIWYVWSILYYNAYTMNLTLP